VQAADVLRPAVEEHRLIRGGDGPVGSRQHQSRSCAVRIGSSAGDEGPDQHAIHLVAASNFEAEVTVEVDRSLDVRDMRIGSQPVDRHDAILAVHGARMPTS
jgi:hypothetical protein